jgi:hypothetical protein
VTNHSYRQHTELLPTVTVTNYSYRYHTAPQHCTISLLITITTITAPPTVTPLPKHMQHWTVFYVSVCVPNSTVSAKLYRTLHELPGLRYIIEEALIWKFSNIFRRNGWLNIKPSLWLSAHCVIKVSLIVEEWLRSFVTSEVDAIVCRFTPLLHTPDVIYSVTYRQVALWLHSLVSWVGRRKTPATLTNSLFHLS